MTNFITVPLSGGLKAADDKWQRIIRCASTISAAIQNNRFTLSKEEIETGKRLIKKVADYMDSLMWSVNYDLSHKALNEIEGEIYSFYTKNFNKKETFLNERIEESLNFLENGNLKESLKIAEEIGFEEKLPENPSNFQTIEMASKLSKWLTNKIKK
jgi:hypothetical protein